MQTVYVDVLFLINFSVDYLALYLTGQLLRLPMRRVRLIAASVSGALYALWALLFCTYYALLLLTAIGAVILTCLLAYPRGGWCVLKRTVFVCTMICAALGCLVLLLHRILAHLFAGYDIRDNGMKVLVFTALTAVSGVLIALGNHLISDVRGTKTVTARVLLGTYGGALHLLVDTGNMVRDPVSGRHVIFMTAHAADRIFGGRIERMDFYPERRRAITVDAAVGKRTILAILPERVEAEGRCMEAYLAVLPQDTLRQYDGIFPASLLT